MGLSNIPREDNHVQQSWHAKVDFFKAFTSTSKRIPGNEFGAIKKKKIRLETVYRSDQ